MPFDPNRPAQTVKKKFDPNREARTIQDRDVAAEPQQDNVSGPAEQTGWSRLSDTVMDFDPQRAYEGFGKGPNIGEKIPILGPMMQRAGAAASGKTFEQIEGEDYAYSKKYPETDAIKSIAGGVMFPGGQALKVGGQALGKIPWVAEKAAKYIPSAMNWGPKTLGAGGLKAASNTAEGAIAGGGDALARGRSGSEAWDSAGEGAKWGALFGGAPVALAATGRAVARLHGGVQARFMNQYRKNPDAVNNFSVPEAVEEAAEDIRNVHTKGEDLKLEATERTQNRHDRSKADAQAKYRSIDADHLAAQRELKGQIGSLEEIKKNNLRETKEAMEARLFERKAAHKKESGLMQREASDEIFTNMGKAREQISAGSANSFDKLPKDVDISLAPFKSSLTRGINQKKIGDAQSNLPGMDRVRYWRSRLDEISPEGNIKPKQAKLLLQELDAETSHLYNQDPGAFMDAGGKYLLVMRSQANRKLRKLFPEFAEAMDEFSPKARALNLLKKKLPAKPDAMYSAIGGIDDVSKLDRRKALESFDQALGTSTASKALKASEMSRQKLSHDPAEVARYREMQAENIPAKFVQAQDGLKFKKLMAEDKVSASQLARDKGIRRKQTEYQKSANEHGETIKGLGEDGFVQHMLSYANAPEKMYTKGKKLSALGELSGKGPQHYPDMAMNYATKQHFQTTRPRGSAGVNMGTMSASALGKMLGVSLQKQGGMELAGNIIGGFSDLIGPKAVKVVIDMVDSPIGQRIGQVYRQAAARGGPNSMAVAHTILMKNDPEYRDAFNFYNSQESE